MTALLSRIRTRVRPVVATTPGVAAPAEPQDALAALFGRAGTPTATTTPQAAPQAQAVRIAPAPSRRSASPTYVTDLVEQADSAPERMRLGGEGHLHASSLINICERQHVLAAMTDTEMMRGVTGSDRLVWAIGRAVERHVRTQFIKARQFGGIYGRWTCDNPKSAADPTCRATGFIGKVGIHDAAARCTCGGRLDTYNEPSLWDDDNGFVGNPDLTFALDGLFVVTEIKSMEKERFQDLAAPLADHVHQAILYRDLYRRLGFPVADFVIILYVSKGYSFKRKDRQGRSTIYREFRVDATQPHLQRLVETSLASARLVKDAKAGGPLPPRHPQCHSVDCARAKECPLVTRCLNMD